MNTPSEKKLPTHRVYHVKGEGDTAKWIEPGAVWELSDGKGYDVVPEGVPAVSVEPFEPVRAGL